MGGGDPEAWTLMSIGIFVIILRVYSRWSVVGFSKFQLDDYLMPLVAIIFAAEATAAYMVLVWHGLANTNMTPEERATLSPSSEEYRQRVLGSKIHVIGTQFYALILWLVKFSIVVFYSRLTAGLESLNFPRRIRITYVILGVTYVAVVLTLFLSCRPFHKFWQINPDPGNSCQAPRSRIYLLTVLIPNVLTDILLLSVPLPLLWKVNISLRKKILLMCLYGGGIFVIAAAIIRVALVWTAGRQVAVTSSKWACRETFVALIVANLPIFQPFVRQLTFGHGFTAFISSARRRPSQRHALSRKDIHQRHRQRREHEQRERAASYARKRALHPLSVPADETVWGIEGGIMLDEEMGSAENEGENKNSADGGNAHEHEHRDADRGGGSGHSGKKKIASPPPNGIVMTQEMVVESAPWLPTRPNPALKGRSYFPS